MNVTICTKMFRSRSLLRHIHKTFAPLALSLWHRLVVADLAGYLPANEWLLDGLKSSFRSRAPLCVFSSSPPTPSPHPPSAQSDPDRDIAFDSHSVVHYYSRRPNVFQRRESLFRFLSVFFFFPPLDREWVVWLGWFLVDDVDGGGDGNGESSFGLILRVVPILFITFTQLLIEKIS